jgi:hypothetical protein
MALSIYDTAALIRTVEYLKEPQSFLLDTFFPNVVTSQTEFVAIDVFTGKRRLSPFVNPLIEGRLVEPIGFRSDAYKPPYIKDKRRLDPMRPVRRSMGERIGGDMTPQAREAANLGFELQDQINMLTRRLEWMAAQALALGSITVVGDGVPQAVVNFGRSSNLSIALSGAARWGEAGVSPVADIDAWSVRVLQESGFPVTDVLFTPGAWAYFRADPIVGQIIASFNNGAPDLRVQGNPAQAGAQFMGTWGSYRLHRYYDWYVDPVDNTEKPMIADNTVVLSSANVDGVRAFATIMDPEVNYASVPYAPKSWTTQDPGARWIMLQSAPLVIPTRVNASLAATVR